IRIQTGEGAGDDVVISGTLTGTDDDLTIDAGSSGDITLTGAVNLGTGSLTIVDADTVVFGSTLAASTFTQSDGTTSTTINNAITTTGGVSIVTGLLSILSSGDINAGDAVSLTATTISTTGDITTSNDNVTFTGSVVLTGNVAINTGAGAGTITFTSTVDGTTDFAENLTLTAGSV
ncbi:MAG: hypothetical protein EBY50_10260, partial [Rhodobacteraceae bacterium]|nr:hypothetical protein [Paracoccaceae bacterium]